MRRHGTLWTPALALICLLAASCGGGGNPILVTGLIASFAAGPSSGPPRIHMQPGPAAGEVFSVEIHAQTINNLYGTAFTVLYDPLKVKYLGCDASSSILTTSGAGSIDCDDALVGGAKFSAALENNQQGALNVRASLDGLVPGVQPGTGLLLTLTFEALDQTLGEPIDFDTTPTSREVQVCPPGGPPLPACSMLSTPFDPGTLDVIAG